MLVNKYSVQIKCKASFAFFLVFRGCSSGAGKSQNDMKCGTLVSLWACHTHC